MCAFNANLLADLAHRRVVVFLGSGVSSSAQTRAGTRMMGWERFLVLCCDSVSSDPIKRLIKNLLKQKDYLSACELLKSQLSEKWEYLLRAEYGQVATPSNLHKAIINLDQRIYITTNFDKMLENAWRDNDTTSTHYPKVLNSATPAAFNMLRDDSKYIIKLHGDIDNISEMIFTKTEYIKGAFENNIYSEFLSVLFLTHTFLFIGFSMNDPAISQLIEKYAFKFPDGRPHYMFVPKPVAHEIIELNKKIRKLYLLPYSAMDNHKELEKNIIDLGNAMKLREKEIVADAKAALITPQNG